MTAAAPHFLTVEELARETWATCGPASLAALLGRPLAEIRHAFPNQREGRTYTTLKHMLAAVAALGIRCERTDADFERLSVGGHAADAKLWPTRGLAIIQFVGSWSTMPFNHPAQLQRTHWVAVQQHPIHDRFVFDINSVGGMVSCMGPGWDPWAVWEAVLAPQIARHMSRKATGGWWVRAGLEVPGC